MTDTTFTAWVFVIIFALALVGTGFLIKFLIDKIEKLKKPSVAIKINDKELEKIVKLIHNLSFEHRLFVLQLLFGPTRVMVSINNNGRIILEGCGAIAPDLSEEKVEYAG